MIVKASQRGNARELAQHLMNEQDNERVEVHAVRGFIGNTVHEALTEIEAISRGTKCTQPLFSVSLNPPKTEIASVADFKEAIALVAEKNGLQNQPYVMVFHEKKGRRHAHCVWSRIDAGTMTAINLPFYKNKLKEISKELYLKHEWELPQGHINSELRNPLNFTLAQWQQAKRLSEDPKVIKQTLKECWSISDNKQTFENALEQHGYYLAKGDRRGFVVTDWRGEIYSLSKWTGVKTKTLKARLGEPENLPSVDETKDKLDHHLKTRIQGLIQDVQRHYQSRFSPVLAQKSQLLERHTRERDALDKEIQQREQREIQERQARFRSGLRGIWDRVTGKHNRIKDQNETEACQSLNRDQSRKDELIQRQLNQRLSLQERLDKLEKRQYEDIQELKKAVFSKLPDDKIQQLQQEFIQPVQNRQQGHTIEI